MARCTAPVRGHVSVAGAASCPVHGVRSSREQVAPVPVVEPSVRVVPLSDGGQREEWWVDGRLHRTDGPAVVARNAAGVVVREAWWVDGRLHRTDGPAEVMRNDAGVVVSEEWCVEGEPSTPAEVLGLFLADKGAKDLSPEALEFLAKGRHYHQWGDITADEIALARLLHPVTEVT